MTYPQHPAGSTVPTPHPPPPGWVAYPWPPAPNHPRATAALTLGILSVLGLSVLAPMAWYYGATTMRDIDREPGRWRGRGQAKSGLVMGIIGTGLLALGTIFLLLIVTGIAVINGYDSGYPS